jgi:hypothetical protein
MILPVLHFSLFTFILSCSSLLFLSVPARKEPSLDTDYTGFHLVLVCLGVQVCLIVQSKEFLRPISDTGECLIGRGSTKTSNFDAEVEEHLHLMGTELVVNIPF